LWWRTEKGEELNNLRWIKIEVFVFMEEELKRDLVTKNSLVMLSWCRCYLEGTRGKKEAVNEQQK
jgi:hypothetical protein